MIVGIHGRLEARGPDWVHVRMGGFTVQASVPASALGDLGATGTEVHLFTYLAVREDDISLYGFPTAEALGLFKLLLEVNGVGPRSALAILSAMKPADLAMAIASGNEAALTKVHGVGKKTASRILLELKGKIEKEWGSAPQVDATSPDDMDVLAALGALGYTLTEARDALGRLPASAAKQPLEDRIRLALRQLSR